MIIKKLLDQRLINAFDINIALANPVRKVSQSSKVIINSVWCIAAVKQVQHESINVGGLIGFREAILMCGGWQSSLEPPEVSEFSLQDTGKTMSS